MTAHLTIETFPNEAAAAYIRGKAVADPTNFGNLPDQLKQRAFTVASIEQLDALKRMRDIIAKLPEGASWDEAKRELAAEISPFIDVDDDSKRTTASRAHAEFLLRTHGFRRMRLRGTSSRCRWRRTSPTGSTRRWATAACGPATPRLTARCSARMIRGGRRTTRRGTGAAGVS